MSLAVGEHRPPPPPPQRNAAGCVGIFFQLFSKKKLLSSHKLLPPPAAKKFAGDDRMPRTKLLLIAEENRGGFPVLQAKPGPDLGTRMQTPGVVARLMGLESMPVIHCENPRKGLDSKLCGGESSLGHSRIDRGTCLDNVSNANGELRLQKLQKTGIGGGFLERRSVEAFHKGLVYRSKKKQYKLETPVKSPRLVSRSSAARLVQVANRILEPGLQSRSRAKCAITYEGSWRDERGGDGERLSNAVAGSCKSCGSSVGVKDSLSADRGSASSDLSCGSGESDETMNGSVTVQSNLKAEEMYMMKTPPVQAKQNKHGAFAYKPKLNVESRAHDLMERKKHSGSTGDQHRDCATRKDNSRQSKSPFRERVVQTEKKLNELNRAKNFVAMNKNVNNYARSRSPTKVSSGRRVELKRDRWDRNLARKRTPISRNAETFSTNLVKERCVRNNGMSKKGMVRVSNQSVNRSCTKSSLRKMDCDNITGSNDSGIVSFTFSSPMRRDSRSTTHEEMTQVRRCQGLPHQRDACHLKKLAEVKNGGMHSQKVTVLRGYELSNILEEKIRELSSFDRNELVSGDEFRGRSTVSILEELLSTLTAVTSESRNSGDCCSDVSIQAEISASHKQRNMDGEFQEMAQSAVTATYLTGVVDQPSPVSILDASFSNDSYSLGSLNGSPGSKPQLCLPEMGNSTQSADIEADLQDSASSSNISCLVNNKTRSTHGSGVSETEQGTDFESFSDAELLFKNISFYGSDRTLLDYSLDSFLLDSLESIVDVFCSDPKAAKEGNQLREFLFDCLMECLESKFAHFCRSGFRTWLKLPPTLCRDQLMREVLVEIRGWRDLAGKATDDLVEKDMAVSNMKWTGWETEAFDAGVEIQSDILSELIDEMVIDLC